MDAIDALCMMRTSGEVEIPRSLPIVLRLRMHGAQRVLFMHDRAVMSIQPPHDPGASLGWRGAWTIGQELHIERKREAYLSSVPESYDV